MTPLKSLLSALVLMAAASPAVAECTDFPGGIALCNVPDAWMQSPNAEPENQATYLIDAKTYAILSYGPGAQRPTEAIDQAIAAVSKKFSLDPALIEQTNSGATDGIDGISAVFVDYRVPVAGNWLFYRTTTAWSPNLTLFLTTYGFEHDLAENFDALHLRFIAATKLAK